MTRQIVFQDTTGLLRPQQQYNNKYFIMTFTIIQQLAYKQYYGIIQNDYNCIMCFTTSPYIY